MKVLSIGLGSQFNTTLHRNGYIIVSDLYPDSQLQVPRYSTVDDLVHWVKTDYIDGVLLNLDTITWAFDAAEALRKANIDIPIIGFSAKPGRAIGMEKWVAILAAFLKSGGDTLFVSPSQMGERELDHMFRSLCAIERRYHGICQGDVVELRCGAATVHIDLRTVDVFVNGSLAHIERGGQKKLLRFLAMRHGIRMSYEQILGHMYPCVDVEAGPGIVHTFVCKMKKALAACHPDAGGILRSYHGVGCAVCSDEHEEIRQAA